MNGPEHYREAERLAFAYKAAIGEVEKMSRDTERQRLDRLHAQSNAHALLTKAQVHATLAQAAATVATRAFGPQEAWGGHAIEAGPEWQEVTS